MTDLRDRYERFTAAFGADVRRAAKNAKAPTGQDQYWKAVHDLFTRDVTSQGLRDLVEQETRETYRFFTREIDLSDLERSPWHQRWAIAAWRVFEAMAYRLPPARRILFAVAVPLLLLGWGVYLVGVAAHGGFPGGFATWDGLLIAAAGSGIGFSRSRSRWHFLYFLPEPHQHGALRPSFTRCSNPAG